MISSPFPRYREEERDQVSITFVESPTVEKVWLHCIITAQWSCVLRNFPGGFPRPLKALRLASSFAGEKTDATSVNDLAKVAEPGH